MTDREKVEMYRKQKINRLVSQGKTPKEIAEILNNDNNTSGIVAVIFVMIIFFVIYLCVKNGKNELNNNDKINCSVLAENFIKNELKAPSTAEFSYIGSCEDYVQLTTDSIYEVKGSCDADNSFGAKLRKNFVVKIKKQNGNLNVIDVSVD